MNRSQRIAVAAPLLALLLGAATSSAVYADRGDHEHLNRYETRRIIRHIVEESDHLQDKIDDWIGEHRKERTHLAEELNHRLDHFEETVNSLRSAVLTHDDPWEVRDQARDVIIAAAQLRDGLEHADYLPREVWHNWDVLRDHCNELAAHYHLEPVADHK